MCFLKIDYFIDSCNWEHDSYWEMKARVYPIVKQIIALHALSLLLCYFIFTTAYHLGRYKPSSPSTKEFHGSNIIDTVSWYFGTLPMKNS